MTRRSSVSDRSSYTAVCARAATDPAVLATFKADPAYRKVLEHVSCEQGSAYLDHVLSSAPDLVASFDDFRRNDALGSPETCAYGEYGTFSPTTLRYVKVLADLRELFGTLDDLDIIEIGGGYGGQCLITSVLYSPRSYNLVDLEPCLALQKAYLDQLNVDQIRYMRSNDLSPRTRYDLVISNYAFSECVRRVQSDYLARVLLRSDAGYITCNWIKPEHYHTYTADELLAALPGSQFVDETPKTGKHNRLLTWRKGRRATGSGG
jgi:putative sugar O-methyltransferase